MPEAMFFHTAEATSRLADGFRVVEILGSVWSRRLLDESTGRHWVEYYPHPDDRSPKHLHAEPLPTDLHELMASALSSPCSEDWLGLAAHLRMTFSAERIAEEIDTLQWTVSSPAIRAFASAYVPEDQRDLIGMSLADIAASYERFRKACAYIKSFSSYEGP
jgi:hypothetical protein